MNFESSTQARHWLFGTDTISLCRQERAAGSSKGGKTARVRKFASGFDHRIRGKIGCKDLSSSRSRAPLKHQSVVSSECKLSEKEQETLIRFHANQIQALVGPRAIYKELQRSSNVLATAIMLFRRFYLSNDVVDFDCRHVAVAAAMLASKVEPDEKIQADLLSLATVYIYRKARATPLYGNELRAVSVNEIEAAERALLEGLNYELICFHPTDNVRELSVDLSALLMSTKTGYAPEHAIDLSENVHARSLAVCYRALVSTDAVFLYPPEIIAFAAATLALRSIRCDAFTGEEMEDVLRYRFSSYSDEEVVKFGREVSKCARFLMRCPPMELDPPRSWNEADELRVVLIKLSSIHSFIPPASSDTVEVHRRKRPRYESRVPTKIRSASWTFYGCPRVTPSLSQR